MDEFDLSNVMSILSCVMDITARTYDGKVIFTACSDAPHKRSLRKDVVQQTCCRAGAPERGGRVLQMKRWKIVSGGHDESTQGGIFHA